MEYKEYLKTDHWKQLRASKYTKPRKCGICGGCENLQVHHLNYKDLISVSTSDLRVLCKRCHFLAHDLFNNGKIKFKSDNHHSRFNIIKAAVKKELGISKINMFNNKKYDRSLF